MEHQWSIVKDGTTVTAHVEVDGANRVTVAYEVLAKLLTQAGFTEATDDFAAVDDDDYLHAID